MKPSLKVDRKIVYLCSDGGDSGRRFEHDQWTPAKLLGAKSPYGIGSLVVLSEMVAGRGRELVVALRQSISEGEKVRDHLRLVWRVCGVGLFGVLLTAVEFREVAGKHLFFELKWWLREWV